MKQVKLNAAKYMIDMQENEEDKKQVLRKICQSTQLTKEFVDEYKYLMDKDMFSSSLCLKQDLIDENLDLFEMDLFLMNLEKVYENALNEREKENNNNGGMSPSQVSSMISSLQSSVGGGGPMILGAPETAQKPLDVDLDISIYRNYAEEIKNILKTDFEEVVTSSIRNALVCDLNEDNIIPLLGISNEIDTLIIQRLKYNPDLLDRLILMKTSIEGGEISSSLFNIMPTEVKEEYLGTENVPAEDFINAIVETKDLSWRNKMIDKVYNGEITLKMTTQNLSEELFRYIKCANELEYNNIVKLLKLREYFPNTVSNNVVKYLLIYKNLTEDQLLDLYDVIKRSGCYFELKKMAESSHFTRILDKMNKKEDK